MVSDSIHPVKQFNYSMRHFLVVARFVDKNWLPRSCDLTSTVVWGGGGKKSERSPPLLGQTQSVIATACVWSSPGSIVSVESVVRSLSRPHSTVYSIPRKGFFGCHGVGQQDNVLPGELKGSSDRGVIKELSKKWKLGHGPGRIMALGQFGSFSKTGEGTPACLRALMSLPRSQILPSPNHQTVITATFHSLKAKLSRH
ncbi:unnamed protein product [Nezara viridula]|uniref:Uncharacterized protein n=1 Tax=Nezara viridula TaxID=85310 RepID=A0A9P0MNP8_NEZVI|nr:unnamed protein product [Nezara viridula]